MDSLKPYIPFLRIIAFHYSNFRLIDTSYEDYNEIFSNEVQHIYSILPDNFSIKAIKHDGVPIFSIEWDLFNLHQDLFSVIILLPLDHPDLPLSLDGKIEYIEKKYGATPLYDFLKTFQETIRETHKNDSVNMFESIEKYEKLDEYIYNVFASIFCTFRGSQDLRTSLKYINQLIRISPITASFYLFRIRNLFLFYYQKVIWNDVFNETMLNNPSEILHSKTIKIIQKDIDTVKKLNPSHKILDLFAWNIYIHLHKEKGVNMLLGLEWKIPVVTFNQCIEWVWNYYLYTWNYDEAEKYYVMSKNKNFKIYRKLLPMYVAAQRKDKFLDMVFEMKDDGYEINFYIANSSESITKEQNILTGYNLDYRDINLPLDIDINMFTKMLEKSKAMDDISVFFPFIRTNFHRYFLHQTKISILLRYRDFTNKK